MDSSGEKLLITSKVLHSWAVSAGDAGRQSLYAFAFFQLLIDTGAVWSMYTDTHLYID